MIVNQFSTFPYGGAAGAAKRMHQQLRTEGIDSRFLYHLCEKTKPTDESFLQLEFENSPRRGMTSVFHNTLAKRRKRRIYRQFNEHIAVREAKGEVFAMAELPEPTKLPWSDIKSDVVHLHWISFFADYPSFFQSIPDSVPIVWTLHDMNAFTGGCHYSTGCESFKSGCGNCPQISNPSSNDVSMTTFKVKQKALANKSIHVVTPSQWLCDLAKLSRIWPKQTTFQAVKLGFDLEKFSPIDKQVARNELGIDSDAVLLGFGAEDIRNQRKGFQHLLAALPELNARQSVECLVFGSGKIPEDDRLPKMHHFGFVDSAEQQRLIYSAADIVVVPSREDNQPQVGLEAMACGTPVVGFDAGGIPEYVRDGVTGLVAKLGDESGLAGQISRLADEREMRLTMGRNARAMMEAEFEIGTQTRVYQSIYSSALQARNKTAA